MTHQAIARYLLAMLCGLQGLAMLAVNLNWDHARRSQWPGHARFHAVWQASAFAALAVLEIVLLFSGDRLAEQHFYLAALLAAIPMLGFFVAFLTRSLYGGSIADKHGLPPANLRVFRTVFIVDVNVAAEVASSLVLILIVFLYRGSGLAR